jgi:hypothetical protein
MPPTLKRTPRLHETRTRKIYQSLMSFLLAISTVGDLSHGPGEGRGQWSHDDDLISCNICRGDSNNHRDRHVVARL